MKIILIMPLMWLSNDLLMGWGMEVSVDCGHEGRLDEILPPVKYVAARTLQPTPEAIHLSTAMTRVDSGHLVDMASYNMLRSQYSQHNGLREDV